MQTFLKIFAGILIILAGIGLVLDNHFVVSRETTINATPEEVHRYVNDLTLWPQWSPWQQMDPSVETTLGNITSGVGANQSWSDQSGGGKLVFTQSSVAKGIQYDLTFTGDESVFVSGVTYQQEGAVTRVIWHMEGNMQPLIIGNYFAQMMDLLVGDSFELGLKNLKSVVEKKN